MARTRGPGNLVAHRPRTEARLEARVHADYADMITQDLGGRRESYRAVDDGRPVGAAELLTRPIALFLFACTAFVIVLILWLWQAGVFGQLQKAAAPTPPAPSAAWMGARQAMPVEPVREPDTAPTVDAKPTASTDEEPSDADDAPPPDGGDSETSG